MKQFSQITCLLIGWGMSFADAAEILWSQYCQHEDKMKLLAHLDTDPTKSCDGEMVTLWLREGESEDWRETQTQPIHSLTATALFEVDSWPRHERRFFKVTSSDS